MLIASHQLHYIPWLPYLAKMTLADCFVATDDVQYRKGHFINRNRIAGRQFPEKQRWLTIPVKYPKLVDRPDHSAAINEMLIDTNHAWVWRHTNILLNEYGKTPFWEEVEAFLRVTNDQAYTHLMEPLLAGVQWLRPGTVTASHLLRGETFGDKNRRLIALIHRVGGDGYLMGLGAQNDYIDRAAFSAAGIKLYKLYKRPFTYPQAHEPFMAGLGFVDALANVGRDELWELVRSSFTIQRVPEQ